MQRTRGLSWAYTGARNCDLIVSLIRGGNPGGFQHPIRDGVHLLSRIFCHRRNHILHAGVSKLSGDGVKGFESNPSDGTQ